MAISRSPGMLQHVLLWALLSCANAARLSNTSARQLQATCRAVSGQLISASSKVAGHPLHTVALVYPVFLRAPELGEMGDGCVRSISYAKWKASLAPFDAYLDAIRDLSDLAAHNAIAGCSSEGGKALAGYVSVMRAWAKAKGWLDPASSKTGKYFANRALLTTTSSFIKVQHLLGSEDKRAFAAYIKGMRRFVMALKGGSFNNHELWQQSSLLMSYILDDNAAQATKRANNIVRQMRAQIKDGVVTVEKRCTRSFFYQSYYLDAGLLGLALYKHHTGRLPAGYAALKGPLQSVVDGLSGSNVPKYLAGKFKYSQRVVRGIKADSGEAEAAMPRIRELLKYLNGGSVPGQDSPYVGYFDTLKP